MSINNLHGNVEVIQAKSAVAAGTDNITDASVIDMQGYDGCLFLFSFGAITSGAVTKAVVANKATNTPTLGTDDVVIVTVADDDDDKVVVVDVKRPRFRYLRPIVDRATQNAVLNCIIAIPYTGAKAPISYGASVVDGGLHVSPAVL